jgi:hypothetical protein
MTYSIPFWQANTARVAMRWVPWSLATFKDGRPYGWLRLPGDLCLALNLDADYDERVLWTRGPLVLTRPETDEERQEREEGWAEEAAMEHELNRYTEWYY